MDWKFVVLPPETQLEPPHDRAAQVVEYITAIRCAPSENAVVEGIKKLMPDYMGDMRDALTADNLLISSIECMHRSYLRHLTPQERVAYMTIALLLREGDLKVQLDFRL